MKIKYYIETMRLRTLLLSASGVVLGGFLAYNHGTFSWLIFIFALLTACSLQAVSNLSNELGDYQKGTDNLQKEGPLRSIQLGKITEKELKVLILLTIFVATILGFFLVLFSFDSLLDTEAIIMLSIGLLAIIAAVSYTLGKHAYGYKGFGDVFVFIFFGLIGTFGTYFLLTKTMDFTILIPASAIGFLTVGVLNINNIRDCINDKQYHKNTICVRIGEQNGKIYQDFLIIFAFIFLTIYTLLTYNNYKQFIFLLITPLFVYHLIFVHKYSGRALDKQLPLLVQGTFLLSVLYGMGLIL